ncbi:MAG: hypothetical protein K8I29_08575 [Alphaproteobacteria bacterium]|uniref:GIY-YIG domain-containing protein n=1 Tax=Candidatus Nitrobium versatile TaxID=2884831 RepID=A0A953JEI4_9BACT|nr:hypothetical protein [Candidatus Nitrobium versatile]
MVTGKDMHAALQEYESKYRPPSLAKLETSRRYYLFPNDVSETPAFGWPEPWDHADRQGVYLIFEQDGELLYMGKASMSHCIGSRLGAYFGYNSDRSCKIYDHSKWPRQPHYVITIAVPANQAFEAAGLEEFLIRELRPSGNQKGKTFVSG